jgi:hypothetical protein
MKRLLPVLLTGLLTGLVSAGVSAQSLELVESKKTSIVVGLNDFSMLNILNRKVLHVDVDYQKCELAAKRSQKIGKVLFKPTGNKPFVMFVTDDHNDTYTVNISIDEDKTPDLYTIKNVIAEEQKNTIVSAKNKYQKSTVKAVELSGGHEKAIHDLTRAKALGDSPKNTDVMEVNRTVPLWSEVKLVELKNYTIGKLTGASYELVNISANPMILAESEFYPLNEKTISVAIQKHTLDPGEMTSVYIVKSK